MPSDLAPLLSFYGREIQPVGPISDLGNAGGLSGSRLVRIQATIGECLARGWPVDGPGVEHVRWVHGMLGRLADLPFVPRPILTRDGRTALTISGRVWEVAPWMPGRADPVRPADPGHVRAAFRALAEIHNRFGWDRSQAGESAPSPGLSDRLHEAETLIRTELARFEIALAGSSFDEMTRSARRWISMARGGLSGPVARLRREAATPRPVGVVLRDVRPDHFLFEGDRLTGLVDFGAMGPDVPPADLSRLLGEWIGPDRGLRAVALDAYDAVRTLPETEAALIDVFDEANAWLGPARWLRWHFVEGRRFDDPDAVAIGLRRCLDRLSDRIRGERGA